MLQAVAWLSILPARSLLPVTFSDPCSGPRGKQVRGALCVAHGIVFGCVWLPFPTLFLLEFFHSEAKYKPLTLTGRVCNVSVLWSHSLAFFFPLFLHSSHLSICPELASQVAYKTVDLLSLLTRGDLSLLPSSSLGLLLLLNPHLLENTWELKAELWKGTVTAGKQVVFDGLWCPRAGLGSVRTLLLTLPVFPSPAAERTLV